MYNSLTRSVTVSSRVAVRSATKKTWYSSYFTSSTIRVVVRKAIYSIK
jgi:hypothetical protein